LVVLVACGGGGGSGVSDARPDIDARTVDANDVDASDVDAMIDAPDAATPTINSYLKASNGGAGDYFGWTMALSADGATLAVAAPYEDSAATGINGNQADKSAPDAGAVYVFTRSGTTWVQQAYLKASNAQAGDQFGSSVAISGDGSLLVVGALAEQSAATGINGDQQDNSIGRAGAAYVFVRSGTTWTQEAYVKASNTNRTDPYIGNERFGSTAAVSTDGATIAIAAEYEDGASPGINGDQYNQGVRFAGAVYVFTRSGTMWTQEAYVKASNPGMDDSFGRSISLSADGSTMAVGAKYEKSAATGVNGDQADDSKPEAGAVYVFTRNASTWSQQAYVKASNTGQGAYFHEVELSADGNFLVVGADGERSATASNPLDETALYAGAVYTFTRAGTSWTQQSYLKAPMIDQLDSFGCSVDIAGNTLVVGARGEASNATGLNGNQADNSLPKAGAVYRYIFSTMWTLQDYVKASNTGGDDLFGHVVQLSADGMTLAAAAYGEASNATGVGGNQLDNSAPSAGAVYVFP